MQQFRAKLHPPARIKEKSQKGGLMRRARGPEIYRLPTLDFERFDHIVSFPTAQKAIDHQR